MNRSELVKKKQQHQNFALFIKAFLIFCMIASTILVVSVIYLGFTFFTKPSEASNMETTYKVCLEAGKDVPGSTLESITKTCDEAIKRLYKDKE